MRNRDVESGITMEYLEGLRNEYEDFIAQISRSIPVIRVSWEQFRDVEEMVQVIDKAYIQESFLREVKWEPTKG